MKSSVFSAGFLALFLLVAGAGDARGGEEWIKSGQWGLGAAVAFSTSPYKKYDHQILPLPMISYDSDRLYLKGTGAGVYLLKNENHSVSLGASYFAFQFRPSKTDARELKALNKRRSTMMVDALYSATTSFGQFRIKAAQDVLGHGDGFLADASFRLPIIRTEAFGLYPGVGVEWANEKQNDYYFGVSRKEAARPNAVRHYHAKDGFTPYVSLETKYVISERWEVFAGARLDFLASQVKNSPMVDESYKLGIAAGFQFNF